MEVLRPLEDWAVPESDRVARDRNVESFREKSELG